MKKIERDSIFNVGSKILDDEYKKRIEVVNYLDPERQFDIPKVDLTEILKQLKEYVNEHFETEETQLLERCLPEFLRYVRCHIDLKTVIDGFSLQANDKKRSLPEDLLEFLSVWFTVHMLETDMEYQLFFQKRDAEPRS